MQRVREVLLFYSESLPFFLSIVQLYPYARHTSSSHTAKEEEEEERDEEKAKATNPTPSNRNHTVEPEYSYNYIERDPVKINRLYPRKTNNEGVI